MAINGVKNDEEIKKISNHEIIKRLFSYMKPFKVKIFAVIVLLLIVMGCALVLPYILKITIDKYIDSSNLKGIYIMGAVMVVLSFISMIASKYRINIMASVTNKILLDIRHDLYSHIQKLSFSFFDSRPVGKILARVMGDVNSLQELFTNSVTTLIPESLTLICTMIMMFYINFKLALAAIIILPLLIISMGVIEIEGRKRWQVYRQKRSTFNGFTHEQFSGIRVVQSFAAEEKTSETFRTLITELMGNFSKAVRLSDFFWPLVEVSWGIGSCIVFYYSVKLYQANQVTIGTIVAFTWYIGMFWKPVMNISNFYNSLITNFAAAERLFEIMDINPDIVNKNDSIIMPKIKGSVIFNKVSFGYDSDNRVLHDISFKIKPGERVALVGPTGAGKTTIINLISRFYDADSGSILIDGSDIKFVDIESLRSQMGIMLQDTFLFSTTIMENIRYGKLEATDEECIKAAKAVNAHEFIMKLEKGYETEVNERGSRLSVGQRQLISFARALLANPRILILDEATSNIDTFTERLVQNGIEKLLHGRTSFVIAHRLSTIRDCDKIMVIDEGKIKESGTHDELIKFKGLYYDLYMSQYKFLNEGA